MENGEVEDTIYYILCDEFKTRDVKDGDCRLRLASYQTLTLIVAFHPHEGSLTLSVKNVGVVILVPWRKTNLLGSDECRDR